MVDSEEIVVAVDVALAFGDIVLLLGLDQVPDLMLAAENRFHRKHELCHLFLGFVGVGFYEPEIFVPEGLHALLILENAAGFWGLVVFLRAGVDRIAGKDISAFFVNKFDREFAGGCSRPVVASEFAVVRATFHVEVARWVLLRFA
jgi:hypothetical protein